MDYFNKRSLEEWNTMYQTGATVWDQNTPDGHLVSLVEQGKVKPCMTIDIGCGRGNESLYLAQKGFQVIGMDISPVAIAQAKERIPSGIENLFFSCVNFLDSGDSLKGLAGFALDRRAFHFLDEDESMEYVRILAFKLRTGGKYMLIVSSEYEEGDTRKHYSEEALRMLFHAWFDLLSIELVTLENHDEKPKSYVCLWERNDTPIELV